MTDSYLPQYGKNFGQADSGGPHDVRVVGTLDVTQDAIFRGRIFFTTNVIQPDHEVTQIKDGVQGEKGDDGLNGGQGPTGERGERGFKGAPGKAATWPAFVFIDPATIEARYPVFCAVNGLTGHVQIRGPIPDSEKERENLVHDVVAERRIDEHIKGTKDQYVLMGDLRALLKYAKPKLQKIYRNAYGIRMKWNEGFAMLKLLHVNRAQHPAPEQQIFSGTNETGGSRPVVRLRPWAKREQRKDTVLAFGGTKDTLLRVRYIGGAEVHKKKNVTTAGKPAVPRGAEATPYEKFDPYARAGTQKGASVLETPSRGGASAKTTVRRKRVLIDPLEGGGSAKEYAQYRDVLVVHRDGVTINGPLYSTRSRPSDGNLKEAIEPIQGALDKVMALRGVSYAWKEASNKEGKKREYGLIAQEVKRTCPEAVSRSPQDFLAIDFDQITPLLLEALKQQQELIVAQRARLDELEKRLDDGRPAKKKRKTRKPLT